MHAATGGVGLAVLSLASGLGCKVLSCTTGTPAKRARLRGMLEGRAVCLDSRSTTFAEDLAVVVGSVSLVLNSLTSPGHAPVDVWGVLVGLMHSGCDLGRLLTMGCSLHTWRRSLAQQLPCLNGVPSLHVNHKSHPMLLNRHDSGLPLCPGQGRQLCGGREA